ncbi:MAG: AI-2E family transporter [Chitinispirillaceae bacterium]
MEQSKQYHDGMRKAIIAVSVVFITGVALFAFGYIAQVLFLFFGGVLLAVFLSGVSGFLSRQTILKYGWALGLVIGALVLFLVLTALIAGPSIVNQLIQLIQRIPDALNDLEKILQASWAGREVIKNLPEPNEILNLLSNLVGTLPGMFSTAAGALITPLVISFLGIYMAADPGTYLRAVVCLLPKQHRKRGEEVMAVAGRALHMWLIGRLSSMAVVGILTTIGLLIIDVPLALALGSIAALLSFIPYIGPALSLLPAILIALAESPVKAFYVLIVFAIVQFLESYIITPLIQQQATTLPPALLITAQLLMGLLAGGVGVLLATPLAVVIVVMIQMLYVQDVLGDMISVMGLSDGNE